MSATAGFELRTRSASLIACSGSTTSPIEAMFNHRVNGLDLLRFSLAANVYACKNQSHGIEERMDIQESTVTTASA
jgi:hypothetical protein